MFSSQLATKGTDIDRFVATLRAVGVTTLIDVRAVAVSRKKGFSKNGLRDRLKAEGIAYVHLVELGDPKPGREAARSGRYADFRRIYEAHLETGDAIDALNMLDNTVPENTVCLMCFERDPATCHRRLIADRLKSSGLAIFDLYGDEPGRHDRYAETMPRCHRHQSDTEPQSEAR